KVTYVRNITDIDDKIIQRAAEKNISITELTDFFTQAMHKDAHKLGVALPDKEPRATAYMAQIIELIQTLIHKKHAYVSANGDVYFSVKTYHAYGALSQQNIDELLTGVRIDVADTKSSPLDFVLWKTAKKKEPAWQSPWGAGRPGWHIECSAMSMHELGEHFDIHGGGRDLEFPHHENEIAQSECASGKKFANYWLHVGLLQINHEKMSKSLNNFLTIEQALARHNPEVIRYFLLSSHYRSKLNYTEETILNAQKALHRLYQTLKNYPLTDEDISCDLKWVARFNAAMFDDFNTPIALAVLFELSHELNKSADLSLAKTLKELGGVLGILQQHPDEFLQQESHDDMLDKQTIDTLISERLKARHLKNWAKADAIRAQLLEAGIELEDTQDKTTWRRSIKSV
ncbi:MAG TPA: cysteine--tRNA ligase, partial [Legionellales bacterium]|nr:cysteine--tRNA ligase [Legionellales bacterium]